MSGRKTKMTDETSIKALFQGLIPSQLSIITARVTSVSPLKCVSCNNEKLQITSGSLIVPNHLKKHTENVSFFIENKTYTNVKMAVDSALKVNDIVFLLYLEQKSKFFVLGRGG